MSAETPDNVVSIARARLKAGATIGPLEVADVFPMFGSLERVEAHDDDGNSSIVFMRRLSPADKSLTSARVDTFLASARRLQQATTHEIMARATAFDYDADRNALWIAYARPSGRTLKKHLEGRTPARSFPTGVLQLWSKGAEALEEQANAGFVHGLLASDFLFVDPSAQLTCTGIIGAGLRVLMGIEEIPSDTIEQWAFRAPETFRGDPLTPAADIYALSRLVAVVLGAPIAPRIDMTKPRDEAIYEALAGNRFRPIAGIPPEINNFLTLTLSPFGVRPNTWDEAQAHYEPAIHSVLAPVLKDARIGTIAALARAGELENAAAVIESHDEAQRRRAAGSMSTTLGEDDETPRAVAADADHTRADAPQSRRVPVLAREAPAKAAARPQDGPRLAEAPRGAPRALTALRAAGGPPTAPPPPPPPPPPLPLPPALLAPPRAETWPRWAASGACVVSGAALVFVAITTYDHQEGPSSPATCPPPRDVVVAPSIVRVEMPASLPAPLPLPAPAAADRAASPAARATPPEREVRQAITPKPSEATFDRFTDARFR